MKKHEKKASVYGACERVLGFRKHENRDWFEKIKQLRNNILKKTCVFAKFTFLLNISFEIFSIS